MYIKIDNLDEILEGIKEFEESAILAAVNATPAFAALSEAIKSLEKTRILVSTRTKPRPQSFRGKK